MPRRLAPAEAGERQGYRREQNPRKRGGAGVDQEPGEAGWKESGPGGHGHGNLQARGCWAMLHDLDSDAQGQVRVKQEDDQSNFKAFLPEHQGKTVVVTGELHETRIDTTYLDKWETRVKAGPKESGKGEEAEHSQEAVLKQIAGLREKLAKSGKSYLSSLQVAVDKWEVKRTGS